MACERPRREPPACVLNFALEVRPRSRSEMPR